MTAATWDKQQLEALARAVLERESLDEEEIRAITGPSSACIVRITTALWGCASTMRRVAGMPFSTG